MDYLQNELVPLIRRRDAGLEEFGPSEVFAKIRDAGLTEGMILDTGDFYVIVGPEGELPADRVGVKRYGVEFTKEDGSTVRVLATKLSPRAQL